MPPLPATLPPPPPLRQSSSPSSEALPVSSSAPPPASSSRATPRSATSSSPVVLVGSSGGQVRLPTHSSWSYTLRRSVRNSSECSLPAWSEPSPSEYDYVTYYSSFSSILVSPFPFLSLSVLLSSLLMLFLLPSHPRLTPVSPPPPLLCSVLLAHTTTAPTPTPTPILTHNCSLSSAEAWHSSA